jgi:small GTP-binding protein
VKKTPKGNRLHIALFGRRNAGKSALLNALTRQQVSIVSAVAGTTTDPVEKPMELLPIGPVVFIDTAGVDDSGTLGEQRVEKTRQVIDRTDVALIVCPAGEWGEFEDSLLNVLAEQDVPRIVVFNKTDLQPPDQQICQRLAAGRRTDTDRQDSCPDGPGPSGFKRGTDPNGSEGLPRTAFDHR